MTNNATDSQTNLRWTAPLLSLAVAAAGACSASPAKPDGQQATGQQAAADGGAEQIPPLSPLEQADTEPAVTKLGAVDHTSAYEVGDLTVIHRKTPANSVVAARIYISGGSTHLSDDTAGLERLAVNTAVNGGTESHGKDQFNAMLSSTGSQVSAFSSRDFSGYSMKSVVDNFDQTWELMVEAMVEPKLPKAEVELQRQQQLASIKSLRENPDRYVAYIASKLLFAGHPYETFQLGTADTVGAFDRQQIAAYQRAMIHPDQMTLVVVGNIPDKTVLDKAKAIAGVHAAGRLPDQKLQPFDNNPKTLATETKQIPTHYIFGLFAAPGPGDADYPAMLVATEYLSDRLFEEVRTKRHLTYAVSAGLSDRRTNYGYLYVTAANPAKTMPVIFEEVQKLKDGQFEAEQLDESRNVFVTQHYMDLETNASQAGLLARAHLVARDWDEFADTIARLEAVTPDDVQRVTKKYMNDYHFGVVGGTKTLDKSLFDGTPAKPAAPTKPEASNQ